MNAEELDLAELGALNEEVAREYVDGLRDVDFLLDVRRMVAARRARPQAALSAPPFSEQELAAATLAPPAIVEGHLYRDLAVQVGPGWYQQDPSVAVGVHPYRARTPTVWPAHQRQPRPIRDRRGLGKRIGARLGALMTAMELSLGDRAIVLDRLRVLDMVGRPFKLCELDGRGNVSTSPDVDRLIEYAATLEPGLIQFDPLA